MRELFSPSIFFVKLVSPNLSKVEARKETHQDPLKVGPLLVDLDAAFAVVAFDVGGRRRTVCSSSFSASSKVQVQVKDPDRVRPRNPVEHFGKPLHAPIIGEDPVEVHA